MFDILVAGEINPDLILSGNVVPEFGQVEKLVDSATFTVGSSSVIFACGAARLGLEVAFIGVCGEDVFGTYMLDEMDKRGVDISNMIILPDGQTGLSVILQSANDRAILTHSGLIAALTAEDVCDDLLRSARHLHIASYFLQSALQPGIPELFTRAHAFNLTTSLDTNWDPSCDWRGFDELLHLTDIFLPNENEALALSGAPTVEAALPILGQKSQVVAVKCGGRGAMAHQGNKTESVPALPVGVVDTVGAGDTFDAGFLYGWLNGWNLKKTLTLAAACGSLSTRSAGGVSAQPTLQEALKYV